MSEIPPFQESTRRLATWAYALVRLLEFEGAWLALVPNAAFKICLGINMGILGRELERVRARLGELLHDGVPVDHTGVLERKVFSVAASLKDERDIAAFLVAFHEDLLASAQRYLSTGFLVADEPTFDLAKGILLGLEPQLASLRSFSKGRFELETHLEDMGSAQVPVAYTGRESALPHLVDRPAREETWVYSAESIFRHKRDEDLISIKDNMKRLLHFVYVDIEIGATEVCARSLAEFREMPIEFKTDLARQCWDEARHAILFRNRLVELGGCSGEFSYSGRVWASYMKGRTLAERLTIQHVLQEGNGFDDSLGFVSKLRELGDFRTAEIYDFVIADEALHVKLGNRWLINAVRFSATFGGNGTIAKRGKA